MIRTLLVLIAALALTGLTPKPSPSVQTSSAPVSGTFGVWTVHMTQVNYNNTTGNFSTPNHVTMTRNGGDVSADRANGNAQSKTAVLSGNVVVHDVQGAFGANSGESGNTGGVATLTTNKLQIDGLAKVYVASGDVHYTKGTTDVTADQGTLDDRAHVLYLQGNVHVVQGDRSLVADRVRYDTVSGDAHAEGGNVILEFPGGAAPGIATPRPIHIKNPLAKKAPQPTPSP